MIRNVPRPREGRTVFHHDRTATLRDPVTRQWIRGDGPSLLRLHEISPRWKEHELERFRVWASPEPRGRLAPPPGHETWLTLLEWSDRWQTDPVPFSLYVQTFHPDARQVARVNHRIFFRVRALLKRNGIPADPLHPEGNSPFQAWSLTPAAIDHIQAYFHAWDTARQAHAEGNTELLNAAERDLFRLNKPAPEKASDLKKRRARAQARYHRLQDQKIADLKARAQK